MNCFNGEGSTTIFAGSIFCLACFSCSSSDGCVWEYEDGKIEIVPRMHTIATIDSTRIFVTNLDCYIFLGIADKLYDSNPIRSRN